MYIALILLSLFGLLSPFVALGKPSVVAVIDTGIDVSVGHLCKDGHRDFSGSGLADTNGHGTHIAGLIARYAGNADFCVLNIKFYNSSSSGAKNVEAMVEAINYATMLGVDYINISGGGPQPDTMERTAISRALDKGIKVIAAAGNDGKDLDKDCDFYPACYDNRITVVGNLTNHMIKSSSSNFGNFIKNWEIGTDVFSNLPGGKRGYMTGTSQAAAIKTGKLVSVSKSFQLK